MDQIEHIAQKRPSIQGTKYRRIHRHLLQQFREGAYQPNEPLPGVRSLSKSMKVAVGTVRQAIHELENGGFIHRIPGKGTFFNSLQQQRAQLKTNIFSVIVPSISEDPYPELVAGVEQAAEGRFKITVGSANYDVSQQKRLISQAVEDNVAGVAIVPSATPTPPEHICMLHEKQIPVVFCHRDVAGVTAPLVCWSFEDVGRMAAENLLAHGHRLITGLFAMRYTGNVSFSDGIRSAFQKEGIDTSNYRVVYHGCLVPQKMQKAFDMIHDAIREALQQILNDKNRTTAIFTATPIEAELGYLIATDLGFRIPEDLSLIYFGGKQTKNLALRHVSCVARDERMLGVHAGKLLCEMSSGLRPHENLEKIEVPLELLPGKTVGPPPGAFDES